MVFLQQYFYSEQYCFHSRTDSFNVLQIFQTVLVKSSTQSSIIIQNSSSIDYYALCHPIVQVFCLICQVSLILGIKSCSPKFLIKISSNCRPPSHQSILCIVHFYPFLTKYILFEICRVCLVSLPFLAVHIADLLSNTITGASYGTISGSLFNNS